MCYYDYCAVVVAVEVDEKRKNIVSCRNVKVACRLIAKKNRGVVDKRSCDSYTLLLTARKLCRVSAEQVFDTQLFYGIRYIGFALFGEL